MSQRRQESHFPADDGEPKEVFEMDLVDGPEEIPQVIVEEGFEEYPLVIGLWKREGPGCPLYCVKTEVAVYRIVRSSYGWRADKVVDESLFVKRPKRKKKKLLVTPLFSPDDGEPRPGKGCSVLLVINADDGKPVAAVPGKVACQHSALKDAGFEEFTIGPGHGVSAEECEQYLESHGPTSRRTILRQVRQYCAQNHISLGGIAAEKRFKKCDGKSFGAALWLVWKERLIAPEKIGVTEVETSEGLLVRIGPHLLLINKWEVTYESCTSVRSAEDHMSKVVTDALSEATT